MNTLVVKDIRRSIELMDEFEDGEYEYLELSNWFWVKDSINRHWVINDNTGIYDVSLMVAKVTEKKNYCDYEPTMTEFRQKQHHGINLDEEYPDGSMDQIIRDACKSWKVNEFIELSKVIRLRAQTSWNRMDYGCEWLGGGDWEEKTLYGETTDYFITGVILREPYKSTEQEAREIVADLKNRIDENNEFIDKTMAAFKHVHQPVIHNSYGEGVITEVFDDKMRVAFANKSALFKCPDGILQGYFRIPEHNEVIEDATNKRNENVKLEKWVKRFEYAEDDFRSMFYAVLDYKNENN